MGLEEDLRDKGIEQKHALLLLAGGGLDLSPKVQIHDPEFLNDKNRHVHHPDRAVEYGAAAQGQQIIPPNERVRLSQAVIHRMVQKADKLSAEDEPTYQH